VKRAEDRTEATGNLFDALLYITGEAHENEKENRKGQECKAKKGLVLLESVRGWKREEESTEKWGYEG
jgi:hypothetical protein